MLTPWSFVVPTIVTHLDPTSGNQDDLDDPSDLSWTHHLHIYAFAPFSTIRLQPGEPHPPPHSAVHIKTIDLPRFLVDFPRQIPPPRLSIRADPPPRYSPPTHPEGRQAPFHPDPKSGIFIIDIYGQMPEPQQQPHYQIVLLKSVLLPYLPSPDSSLLTTGYPRQAAVVPWANIAPKVRMFIPDSPPSRKSISLHQYLSSPADQDRSVGLLCVPEPFRHGKAGGREHSGRTTPVVYLRL